MNAVKLSRRSFLKVSATAAGGLMIAVYTPARGASPSTSETFAPSGFIRIEPDNHITLWAKCPDMGQGVKTAFPMLIAEELEADWSRVHIEQADLNTKLFGGQGSGGSDNIPSEWDTLRRAGAAAREMLIAAAAQAWRVAASECMARNSEVIHRTSGKRMTYGELARTAAEQPVPKELPLKEPKDYRLIGTRVRGVDNQAIITGKPLFGLDAKVPGMLYAVIQKSPVFGGKVASIDDRRARAVAGVRHVVEIKGLDNPTHLRPGVAVVADSTWAAMKGREALAINWDDAPQRGESSENLKRQFQGLTAKPGKALRQAGDVDKALNEATHALEVLYRESAHVWERCAQVRRQTPHNLRSPAPPSVPSLLLPSQDLLADVPVSADQLGVRRVDGAGAGEGLQRMHWVPSTSPTPARSRLGAPLRERAVVGVAVTGA